MGFLIGTQLPYQFSKTEKGWQQIDSKFIPSTVARFFGAKPTETTWVRQDAYGEWYELHEGVLCSIGPGTWLTCNALWERNKASQMFARAIEIEA